MANWYGTCRSNYFRVKDEVEFRNWIQQFEAEVIEKDGLFGIYSTDDYGSIPERWDEKDEGNWISILDEIADHLVTNEVCVVIEAGAEKARYITGLAIAVAWTGERTRISLTDIYDKAQAEFGGDAQITEAIY